MHSAVAAFGWQTPPGKPEVRTAHCVRLGAVLEAHRLEAGRMRPWTAAALKCPYSTLRRWEVGLARPWLATIDALARLYDTSLLTVLAEALPKDARTHNPLPNLDALGGSQAKTIISALLAWEAAGALATMDAKRARTHRRRLGQTLAALRTHHGLTRRDLLPVNEATLKHFEVGASRPSWPALARLANTFGVGPLALVAYVDDPGPGSGIPVASLLACRDQMILDSRNPDRETLVAVPGAPTIAAAVLAWASTIGGQPQ